MTRDKRKRISQTTVIDMGFTKSMITKLLPEPMLANNPYYRSAPKMKLWYEDDVVTVMASPEYLILWEKAQKRKQSAAKAVETKEQKLISMMNDVADKIHVKIIPEDKLIHKVLCQHEQREREQSIYRGDYIYHSYDRNLALKTLQQAEGTDADYYDTLVRWVVNYIRHKLTNYDRDLINLNGQTGKDRAYTSYKQIVLQKIAEVYPQYAQECENQMENIY